MKRFPSIKKNSDFQEILCQQTVGHVCKKDRGAAVPYWNIGQ